MEQMHNVLLHPILRELHVVQGLSQQILLSSLFSLGWPRLQRAYHAQHREVCSYLSVIIMEYC